MAAGADAAGCGGVSLKWHRSPAKARDGRAASAQDGSASAPHRKARSMPVASLRRANARQALRGPLHWTAN
eukprot:2348062-Prymnesium_polylepis.1